MKKIKNIDIIAQAGNRFCLFCGEKICSETSNVKKPCPHVLFIADSEGGISYIRKDIAGMLDEDEWETWKALGKLPLPNAFMVNESLGAPSGLEFYIGLSPDIPADAKTTAHKAKKGR